MKRTRRRSTLKKKATTRTLAADIGGVLSRPDPKLHVGLRRSDGRVASCAAFSSWLPQISSAVVGQAVRSVSRSRPCLVKPPCIGQIGVPSADPQRKPWLRELSTASSPAAYSRGPSPRASGFPAQESRTRQDHSTPSGSGHAVACLSGLHACRRHAAVHRMDPLSAEGTRSPLNIVCSPQSENVHSLLVDARFKLLDRPMSRPP